MVNEVVGKCCDYIEANLSEKLSAEIIAHEMGYSPFYLSRIFKQATGRSLMRYVTDRKLDQAYADILAGVKILDAAIDYGFSTHSAFTKCFKKKYGYPPAYLRFYRCQNEYFNGGNAMQNKNEYTSRNTEELYAILADQVNGRFSAYEMAELEEAYRYAVQCHHGECRYSGEPYINHSLYVAQILADMEAEPPTVIAGLLHDIIPAAEKSFLTEEYGDAVYDLWQKVKHFHKEKAAADFNSEATLIILADRLHNMRTIEFISPEKWAQKAEETIAFFSPLAELVNQMEMKKELEERSASYLRQ